jgi:hypothetical protein
MNGLAEIIPIESRRGRKRRGTPPPQVVEPEITPRIRRRRMVGLCAGLAAVLVALMVVNRAVVPHGPPPAPLTEEMRQGLYQRALDDVKAGCQVPQAKLGLLRQHCVDQARFLQLLPECTADCIAVARGVLTRP